MTLLPRAPSSMMSLCLPPPTRSPSWPSTACSCSTSPARRKCCAPRLVSGHRPPYQTVIATPDGRPVRSESGVSVAADVSLAALARSRDRIDTLVVVGGEGTRAAASTGASSPTSPRSQRGRRGSRPSARAPGCSPPPVCSTATRRPRTGRSCDALADRYPEVHVRPDRIYVHDRDRWTSAGVTAGRRSLPRDRAGRPRRGAGAPGGGMAGRVRAAARRPVAVQRPAARPTRHDDVDRRVAGLARRPPRREPRGRGAGGPRRHEPAHVRTRVPSRDRDDAGGLRRGASGRVERGGCSRRPISPSRPSPAASA